MNAYNLVESSRSTLRARERARPRILYLSVALKPIGGRAVLSCSRLIILSRSWIDACVRLFCVIDMYTLSRVLFAESKLFSRSLYRIALMIRSR